MGKVPRGLKFADAEQLLRDFEDDDNQAATADDAHTEFFEAGNAREDRKYELQDICENINQDSAHLGLKRVGIKLVTKAVEELERSSGKTLDALTLEYDFEERVAAVILHLDPNKAKVARQRGTSSRPTNARSHKANEKQSKPHHDYEEGDWNTTFAVIGGLVILAWVFL